MRVLELLLSKRWILKREDRETYYFVRDELPKLKPFLLEKLGFQLVVNSSLIKLEKIPASAENWMGIREFGDKLDYVFLLSVLMFLEEKESGEQFVLSELTEYLQGMIQVEEIDWTIYRYRKTLVKVMKFVQSSGMIELNDGSEENFAKDGESEVLYENTGISRYFVRNFTRDICDYTSVQDFEKEEWIDVNEDRGIVRRQRVYRRLLLSPGMYRNEKTEEDFNYLRNFRGNIRDELEGLLDVDLHIHKTSAYLVLSETSRLGRTFPEENTLSDIVLLLNEEIVKKVKEGSFLLSIDESILLLENSFKELLEECKRRYGKGFAKTYREMTTREFVEAVSAYMKELGFIQYTEEGVKLLPIAGKVVGRYPNEFRGEEDE